MKAGILPFSLIILIIVIFSPIEGVVHGVTVGKNTQWKEMSDKFYKSKEKQVMNTSAETFSVAVIKALIKMNDLAEIKGGPVEIEATDDTGDTAAFDTASSVSNQTYGNIKVTSLEKVFEEEHSGNDSERKSTFFTQTLAAEILFSNEDGNLLIKHFEEEVNGRKNSNLSVTSEGITFSDLIRELITMGVEIEQQTTPTESNVTLKVPLELLSR